jgi:hypothetical protein
LSQALPLDIALQKANWNISAAPILVGKTDPILLQQGPAWKYILAGIALCGLLVIVWKKTNHTKTLSRAQDIAQTDP